MEVSQQARVIAGRYELESLIGEGGMASVWRARDTTLERPVAVKLLFSKDERDGQRLLQQFLREARIAASVHHRNVIHIVDFGTTEQQPFMVMELLEGETLGQRMHRDPPLSLAEVVQIASLTLRGLAAVHEAGIIHRDLKPDNVFLARDRNGALFPKILDFGISRSTEPRSGRRSALTTRDGMIVGTPEYMSPEQARGIRTIDKRSDIYSMGCILYVALTGELPFDCENVGDLIIQIVTGTAPAVHELRPDIPRAISEVVAKAMARRPEDRFQDALQMQQALLAAAEAALDVSFVRALSEAPATTDTGPRVSSDRLRTLELSVEPAPRPSLAARPAAVPVPASVPVAPAEPPSVEVELPAELKPARMGKAALALLGAGVAAGLALLLWHGGASDGVELDGAARAQLGPAPTAAVEPAAPPPSATIEVQLRNVPAGATVTVDGVRANGTTLPLARDGRNRVIKVTAEHKVPWQVVHHASSDASYDVFLAEAEPVVARIRATTANIARRTASTARHKQIKKPASPPQALRKLDF